MLIVVASILALLTVPLAGGRLRNVLDVEVRRIWTVYAAIVIQVATFTAFPGPLEPIGEPLHFLTYALAGLFLVANRHIPGLWIIGVGGSANLAAIAANGGIMPASEAALRTAGMAANAGAEFTNSAALEAPRLAPLGDIFAIPAAWPLSNVFSIGDALIVIGLLVVLHALSQSTLAPSGGAQFRAVMRQRHFGRVWAAQAVSNVGDFAYALAVAIAVAEHGSSAAVLALVLLSQAITAAIAGLLGGPLVDRFSRRRLMVSADMLRAVAVGSLLLGGTPSTFHLVAVAAVLGACGALFQPALHASLPNLVRGELLVAVNAIVSATFHVAVLVGPMLGALVAGSLGVQAAFALNAGSFLLSALLLMGTRLPRPAGASDAGAGIRAIREGLLHVARAPLLRVLVAVTSGAMFAASLKQPAEPGLIMGDLAGTARDVGLATAAWGLGMIIGSATAPTASRYWPRERLVAGGLGLMGVAVAAAAFAGGPSGLLSAWLLGGLANGVVNVAFETLLQERTPDHVRGRVLAVSESGMDLGLVLGLLAAGGIASLAGSRVAFAVAGVLLLATAAATARWLPLGPFLRSPVVEYLPVGNHVLLRVSGRWRHDGGLAREALRLHADGNPVRVLPDPDPRDHPRWRCGFVIDAETFVRGPALTLLVPGATELSLPAARLLPTAARPSAVAGAAAAATA